MPISLPAYLNLSKVNPPVPKSGSRRERYAGDRKRVFVDYIAEEFASPSFNDNMFWPCWFGIGTHRVCVDLVPCVGQQAKGG